MSYARRSYRLVLACLFAVVSLMPARLQAMPRPGQAAPNFAGTTTSGQAVSLATYRGHVLVVDFFATWCQPCRVSIPHLVEMNRLYAGQGLRLLGMSVDEDGERPVRDFAGAFHINYPLAMADESIRDDFGVRSVPILFVIDKKGRVAEVFRGFNEEIRRSLEQTVKRLLAEK